MSELKIDGSHSVDVQESSINVHQAAKRLSLKTIEISADPHWNICSFDEVPLGQNVPAIKLAEAGKNKAQVIADQLAQGSQLIGDNSVTMYVTEEEKEVLIFRAG